MFTNKTNKMIYWIGIVLFILGTLDPMEGSLVIVLGSLLCTIITLIEKIKYRKWFLCGFMLIATGVLFLWLLSSLGGFGGNSRLSIWWGLTIIPYPLGWLMMVVLFILRKRPKIKLN